ncbi:MAG: ABC transporter ATP-binding protein [Eubacteriales bacterium]|nr:ABC transporter ATP-binding protein [Eubacteriales bacterium]
MRTVSRILRHIRKYRAFVVLSVVLAAVTTALTLYIPILIGHAVDCIAAPGAVEFEALFGIIGRIAAAAAGAGVSQWAMNHINNTITYRVAEDVRVRAFEHIEVLPVSYLDTQKTGDITSRMIADVDQFADGVLMGFTQLFTGVMTILGTLGFMLFINMPITLLVVCLTPLSFVAASFIAKRTYLLFSEQSRTRGELTALTDEMITNLKVVKAFGQEDEVEKRFGEINERLAACGKRATFYSSITNPATRFVNAMVYAAVGIAGAFACVRGLITVGQLSSFLSYANQYTKPFNEISGVATELQNAIASAERVFALIDEAPQEPDREGAAVLTDAKGQVDIRDMSFSYVPSQHLIEHMNLNVRPGERVAIVGPTGCGKSTLINLLMRFYDPQEGSISVDGCNTREMTRASLRQGFGMVLQETWLKSGTIRENIAYGCPDASMEEVMRAAKDAHVDSFIRRMPDGYDTVLSEDGGSLSQGQKQLLCIARLMLRIPPMLILDEATSSIDTRTEQKIQAAFAKLMEGRTSFVVAHRLSTIRESDVILVMRDGHIIEQGNHDELLEKGGFYAELYNSQFAPA